MTPAYTMYLEIVTPDRKVYEGEINLIQAPGSSGSFEILKDHAAFISTLEKGSIKVIDAKGKKVYFQIDSGVIEVSENKIIVLAEIS